MSARMTPEDGDIVVRRERREGTFVYILHTAPGADQYLLRTCEEAVAQAVAVAKRQHVRAWLTDDGYRNVPSLSRTVESGIAFHHAARQ